jgi:hypothetical protein
VTAPPDPVTWLILVYRLPARSGLKAVIRRKATALGAVYPTTAGVHRHGHRDAD